MGVGYTLPRRVGAARAKELAFTGRSFGAEAAMAMGIIDAVHPAEMLAGEAKRIARRFVEASPEALAQAKRLFNRSPDSTPELGRASCRERVWQYVESTEVAGT